MFCCVWTLLNTICLFSLSTDDIDIWPKGELQRQSKVTRTRHGEKLAEPAGRWRMTVTMATLARGRSHSNDNTWPRPCWCIAVWHKSSKSMIWLAWNAIAVGGHSVAISVYRQQQHIHNQMCRILNAAFGHVLIAEKPPSWIHFHFKLTWSLLEALWLACQTVIHMLVIDRQVGGNHFYRLH